MADGWAERLRSLGQSRQAAAELLRRVGERPPSAEYEKLSFGVVSWHLSPRAVVESCKSWLLYVAGPIWPNVRPRAPHLLQANLICPMVDERAIKLQMLQTTSTLKRMQLLRQVLAQLQDVQMSGCTVM